MKITAIKSQVKRKDRFSVYVDDKYSFSLSDYQLVGSGLTVGKEFTAEELDNLIQESNFGKAYERSLNYVMIRPRSEKEIRDYLTRTFLYPKAKVYTDKSGQKHLKPQKVDKPKATVMIGRVIDRLSVKGYINDESFARAWINSRQLTKNLSRRKLWQELKQKGLSDEIINSSLEQANINENQNLQAVVNKKRRLSRYQDDQKLIEFLLRQGFNYDEIKTVMSEEND
jgi:regulatory protein